MSTSQSKIPKFQDLPDSYSALCSLHMPRPIHDETEYWHTAEIMNVLALAGEENLNQDQADYLLILADLIERFDQETLPPLEKQEPHRLIKAHLDNIQMTITDWGKLIGIDKTLASRLLRGERKLSIEHLQNTSKALNLSILM